MISYPLNIKRSEWENLDEEEQIKLRQDVISYFRKYGFPHFKYDIEEQHKELGRLDKFVSNNEMETDGIIRQTMHGLGLCWSYHPHHWDIQCGTSRTPMQVFLDDNLLDKAVKKRMRSGRNINEAMMRKTLKVSGGAQTVSNFRPSVARYIYDRYGGEGYVFDPCMGFGGRMIGAISSPRVKHYEGCDPNTETFNGLSKMAKNLQDTTKVVLNNIGVEEYESDDKFDLVFTSPPYFDTEKYSDEETQSYIKFPTYEKWLNEFLRKLVSNSIDLLKKGGYFIINIANTKRATTLENDFLEIMKSYDMSLEKTLNMTLSKQHSGGQFKYEPIFVYNKT